MAGVADVMACAAILGAWLVLLIAICFLDRDDDEAEDEMEERWK